MKKLVPIIIILAIVASAAVYIARSPESPFEDPKTSLVKFAPTDSFFYIYANKVGEIEYHFPIEKIVQSHLNFQKAVDEQIPDKERSDIPDDLILSEIKKNSPILELLLKQEILFGFKDLDAENNIFIIGRWSPEAAGKLKSELFGLLDKQQDIEKKIEQIEGAEVNYYHDPNEGKDLFFLAEKDDMVWVTVSKDFMTDLLRIKPENGMESSAVYAKAFSGMQSKRHIELLVDMTKIWEPLYAILDNPDKQLADKDMDSLRQLYSKALSSLKSGDQVARQIRKLADLLFIYNLISGRIYLENDELMTEVWIELAEPKYGSPLLDLVKYRNAEPSCYKFVPDNLQGFSSFFFGDLSEFVNDLAALTKEGLATYAKILADNQKPTTEISQAIGFAEIIVQNIQPYVRPLGNEFVSVSYHLEQQGETTVASAYLMNLESKSAMEKQFNTFREQVLPTLTKLLPKEVAGFMPTWSKTSYQDATFYMMNFAIPLPNVNPTIAFFDDWMAFSVSANYLKPVIDAYEAGRGKADVLKQPKLARFKNFLPKDNVNAIGYEDVEASMKQIKDLIRQLNNLSQLAVLLGGNVDPDTLNQLSSGGFSQVFQSLSELIDSWNFFKEQVSYSRLEGNMLKTYTKSILLPQESKSDEF